MLYNHTISFAQAALGAEVEIPTIDGKVKYTIPAGTQPGSTFRLRGKGIPNLRGYGRGDQYVTVTVQIPANLNNAQREALRDFDALMQGRDPQSGEKDNFFFGKKKKK